jgi:bromodomain-containing protein 7/9
MRLVTTNAKKFNPVGSIYHSEAERIETWAEDQIAKAAVSVIEYETDWRLDVEGDEQEEPLEDDEPPEPAPAPVYEPEPTSPMIDDDLLALHAAAIAGGRRPPQRAAVKKIELERAKEAEKEKEKEKSTEKPAENGLDEDGHMPGYKDGIGVFPPDSGWSQVMVELKFRGEPLSCSLVQSADCIM